MKDKLIVKINSNKLKISDLFTTLQSIENGIKKETYGKSEMFIEKVDKGSKPNHTQSRENAKPSFKQSEKAQAKHKINSQHEKRTNL